ncbi:MAG: DUF4172 domain-containing protein [Sphaerochaeta sp.]|nr:DUF4172 domain-containing protein [Sphaerochaeta sp.]
MECIWNVPQWPNVIYDERQVGPLFERYQYEKGFVDALFSVLDRATQQRIHAETLAWETVKSSEIEGERIAYDSVLSSVAKHLDIAMEIKAKDDVYARNVSQIILDAILKTKDPMSLERLFRWHRLLFTASSPAFAPRQIGSFRTGAVYVMQGMQFGNGEPVYEGIPEDRIEENINHLISYVNGDNEQRPLVKSAVVSLLFVAIHPFSDGNGRLSRALSDYVLARGESQTLKSFSISKAIMQKRGEYYQQLRLCTGQDTSLDITSWIVWYLNLGIEGLETAKKTFHTAIQLGNLVRSLDPKLFNSRQIMMLVRLVDGTFFGKLTKEKWMKLTGCAAPTAVRDINDLLNHGFLTRSAEGGRSTSYMLSEQLEKRLGQTTKM